MVHEPGQNFFSAFQTNVFQGFQRKITIKGFTTRKTDEEIEKAKVPEVLTTGKEQLKKEIEESTKDLKAPQKINAYR